MTHSLLSPQRASTPGHTMLYKIEAGPCVFITKVKNNVRNLYVFMIDGILYVMYNLYSSIIYNFLRWQHTFQRKYYVASEYHMNKTRGVLVHSR